MSRSVLGLLVAPEPSPGVRTAVRLLDRWCDPRAADPRHDRVAAWLATSPSAPGVRRVLHGAAPVGVWVETPGAAEAVASDGAIPITDDPAVAEAVDGVRLVVGGGVDVVAIPFVPPFVRARWRRRWGLPADLVVGVDTLDGDTAEAPTGMALAAAVAVRGPRLLEALAWGAPCATDEASARAASAIDGRHVVVAAPTELRDAARALGRDAHAAMISRAGRLLVERRHDRAGAVRALAVALGLVERRPWRRVESILDDLATPDHAVVRRRVAEAMRALEAA